MLLRVAIPVVVKPLLDFIATLVGRRCPNNQINILEQEVSAVVSPSRGTSSTIYLAVVVMLLPLYTIPACLKKLYMAFLEKKEIESHIMTNSMLLNLRGRIVTPPDGSLPAGLLLPTTGRVALYE